MRDYKPYSIPKEPGRWRAIMLAALVHAALLAFLWIGINWQSETPVAVEAEIWDPQVREAAPLPPPPEPVPQPKPEPIVKETPKAEPIEPPAPKVDIALEQEKKRKEQERKDKLAEQDRLAKQKLDQQKQKLEQQKLDQQKQQLDQQKQKLDQQQAEQKKTERLKKAELDKQHKQEVLDAEQRDKVHADEMRRITGAVGSGGSGMAAKSQGNGRADADYAGKIAALIKSRTIFMVPDNLDGNPSVEYDVKLLPDGSVRSISLRKSSGIPGFDEAVKQAIQASQPFPKDKTGLIPDGFPVSYRPKDLKPQ